MAKKKRPAKKRSRKKSPKMQGAREANLLTGFLIREKTFEKAKMFKTHPGSVIRFFASFVIVLVLAVGCWVFFEPDINLVPAPLNYLLFAALIILLAYLQLGRFP